MRVGLMFANGARAAEPDHAEALVLAAEAAGFESLWAVQHIVMPVDHASRYPYSSDGPDGGESGASATVPGGAAVAIADPLVWLAWAGAMTSRIRLATGVLVLPQQHPLLVAKQVATLDRLTGGRVILGVGAGWLREEYEALGADFDDRGAVMDEAIAILRSAWTPGPTEFSGARLGFKAVHVEPKPVGPVPIVVGGHSRAAARRAGRLADGFFPLARQGEALAELVRVARATAVDAGRQPDALEITVDAPRTEADAAVQATLGVSRVVVAAPNLPPDQLTASLERRLAGAQTRTAAS